MILPEKGRTKAQIMKTLEEFRTGDLDWSSGKVFGYIFDPGREVQKVEQDPTPVDVAQSAPVEVVIPAATPLEVTVSGPDPLPVSIDAQTGALTVLIDGTQIPLAVDIASSVPLAVTVQEPLSIDDGGVPLEVVAPSGVPLEVTIDPAQLPLSVQEASPVEVVAATPLDVNIVTPDPVPISAASVLQVEIVQADPSVQDVPIKTSNATFEGALYGIGTANTDAEVLNPHIQLFNPLGRDGGDVDLLLESISNQLYTADAGGGDFPVTFEFTQTQIAVPTFPADSEWRNPSMIANPVAPAVGTPHGVMSGGLEAVVGGRRIGLVLASISSAQSAQNAAGAGAAGLLVLIPPGWGVSVYATGADLQMIVNLRWAELGNVPT